MATKLYQNKYPVPATAKYVVDYVYDNPQGQENYYYQLVRIKDDAILYANKDKEQIVRWCWKNEYKHSEIAFI